MYIARECIENHSVEVFHSHRSAGDIIQRFFSWFSYSHRVLLACTMNHHRTGCESHASIHQSGWKSCPVQEREGPPQAACLSASFLPYLQLFLFLITTFLSVISLTAQETEGIDPTKSWEITEAKWEEVNHYEGRFRVITPAPMLEKTDSLETPLGKMVYHTFFLAPHSDKAENEVYMISYVDYPEGALHQDSVDLIQALLDETQSAAVESMRGELMFSQDGFQQSFPYRYWRIDYLNGRGSIRTKAIVADERFYTIQTVTQRAYGINHSTDRFIDSFYVFAGLADQEEKE